MLCSICVQYQRYRPAARLPVPAGRARIRAG